MQLLYINADFDENELVTKIYEKHYYLLIRGIRVSRQVEGV